MTSSHLSRLLVLCLAAATLTTEQGHSEQSHSEQVHSEPKSSAAPASSQTESPSEPSRKESLIDIVNNADLKDDHLKGDHSKNPLSPAVLRAEVMLDRLHFSPGVIDGHDGDNFQHALQTFESVRNLNIAKGLTQDVWTALTGESGTPVLIEHELSEKDVEGPFYPDLPTDYGELAELKTIGYRSALQKVAALFHMKEDLVTTLNPGVDLKAGSKIIVADVSAPPVSGKVASVVVDKQTAQVLGYDEKDRLLVSYPATIGSKELPSPSGSYKVKGIAFNPVYYYDPDKNFVQGDNKEKLKLPPGPNNPVGTVFIALTKPTYGLHGTPDPSKVDKTASHGCVRMTNWDAEELAHLVKRGVSVSFKED